MYRMNRGLWIIVSIRLQKVVELSRAGPTLWADECCLAEYISWIIRASRDPDALS